MLKKLEEIANKVCSQNNVALYDVEIKHASKGKILVFYITKMGGVSIAECRSVSKDISRILEEEDFIDARYFLEVSSPGLERELKFKKHYVSAINEKVKITFLENDKDKNVTKIGILIEVFPEEIKMEIQDELVLISFSLPKHIKVEVSIYNIKGQKVKNIINDNFIKGKHNLVWDGKDESGKPVPSGIYFFKIESEIFSEIRKCVLLKILADFIDALILKAVHIL